MRGDHHDPLANGISFDPEGMDWKCSGPGISGQGYVIQFYREDDFSERVFKGEKSEPSRKGNSFCS